MIAFALRETGRDPSWIVGGEVPQLGANAGAGEGWLVVEGDESDRSVRRSGRASPCYERRPRPPLGVRLGAGGRRALRGLARRGAGGRARLGARAGGLRAGRPGRAQPAQRGGGAGGAGAHRRPARGGCRGARAFDGVGRRSSSSARRAASRSTTTTRTTRRRSPRRSRPRASRRRAACSSSSNRTSSRGRGTSLASSAAARRGGRGRRHGRLPCPRAAGRRVTGKLVVDALADARPGFAPGWTPTLEDGARFVARRRAARVTSRSRSVPATSTGLRRLIVEELSVRDASTKPTARVERGDAAEDRGGRQARAPDDRRHRRPGARLRAARHACRTRGGTRLGGRTRPTDRPVGLGSNLIAADEGVDALILRLEGELAGSRSDDDLLVAGGGAANAVCLHRARDAGLGGFEFACAIPGTAGGGVRMNAGAYGGDWKQILVRALVVDAGGRRWLTNDELDLSYQGWSSRPWKVEATGIRARRASSRFQRSTCPWMRSKSSWRDPRPLRTVSSK